jgi:hypothetical protein
MSYLKLFKALAILVIIFSLVAILVYAKPFLIPVTFSGLLSILLLLTKKMVTNKESQSSSSVLIYKFHLRIMAFGSTQFEILYTTINKKLL